ncbi:MAG: TIGR00730 family Rossman fold protein [Elusimicrobia bacterium]|nr:TIGR00730 family Rossman fold protein [Elusimicrobiota bacterium]
MRPDLTPEGKKTALARIRQSGTYSKAYEDVEFMRRKELRPVRFQLELLKPETILHEHRIRSTIVVFGSARLVSRSEALRQLEACRARIADGKPAAALKKELAFWRMRLAQSRYYDEARKFGQMVSRTQRRAGGLEFVVVTGGGPGIMEAANRGAYEARGKSVGLNITIPNEQDPNPYITPGLAFTFHYFALRKMHFMMRAKAMVAFPGGFGTLDELFETLTLVQTGKKRALPIVLVGKAFWRRLVDVEFLVEEGLIAPEDLGLLSIVETAQEAWDIIRSHWKNRRHRLEERNP